MLKSIGCEQGFTCASGGVRKNALWQKNQKAAGKEKPFSIRIAGIVDNGFMNKTIESTKKPIKTFMQNFLICGLIGWCNECFWTGLHSIAEHKDKKLTCRTSVWMFPIYGMAALLAPMSTLLRGMNTFLRGVVYTSCIFVMEFASGSFLKKIRACPWDYSKAKWNIKGLVRLDFAPAWFALGLLYEKILARPGR